MEIEGVQHLDHTADVGLRIRADSLPDLFRRAALGMAELIREDEEPSDEPSSGPGSALSSLPVKHIHLEAEDMAGLLASWLRELLFLDEVEGFTYQAATFHDLTATRLRAEVRGGRDPRPPVRELKGVTYHDLAVGGADGDWWARVIFDV